ncbi:hypothetical protein ACFXPJ_08345, partial [Streptomyces goshikiensis]
APPPPPPPATARPPRPVWAGARPPPRFEPGIGGGSLPLFEPPASWDADLRGAQKLLTGYTYSVSFFARDGGSVYYGNSYFTAEDLAGLKPGEVWSGGRARTRKEFREYVKDEC